MIQASRSAPSPSGAAGSRTGATGSRERARATGGSRGFTTTELLVTMGIFGIVMLVSLPGFRSMLENHQYRGAVDRVTSQLFLARQMAVRDKTPYTFTLDTGAGNFSIFSDSDEDGIFEPGDRSFGPYDLGPNVSLVNVSWDSDAITFFPNGTASKTGDIQVVDNKGRTKTIRVNSTTGSSGVLP